MRYSIANYFLIATFRTKGGELISLIDKTDGMEHIWQGNEMVWPWHAPILFPTIGCLVNNSLLINGEIIEHPKHGFFRKSMPEVVEKSETKIVFELKSNEETLKVYPYTYAFKVGYELIKNKLINWFMLENKGEDDMYFMLGGHPGFKIPFYKDEKISDYYVELEYPETLDRHHLNANGLINGNKTRVVTKQNQLSLSEDLFDDDALVFVNPKSKSVSLKSRLSKKSIRLDFHDFSNLGIWSKPKAHFVCLEPWNGRADKEGDAVELKDKTQVHELAAGKTYTAKFMISVNNS